MQIISKIIAPDRNDSPLSRVTKLSNVLYVDLETTGLSAERDKIYLIGCAYHTADGWKMTQWFDETGYEETSILTSFLLFAKTYPTWVHFNGDRFDIPFLKTRIEKQHISVPIESFKSIDLYHVIKPYRKILALPNYQQQTVEAFMGTGRTENRSGGDLVKEYQRYVLKPDQTILEELLRHNEADIKGLIDITPIITLKDIFETSLSVYRAQANFYTGIDGKKREELILFSHAREIPEDSPLRRIVASKDECYLNIEGNKVTLRVPMIEGELKYFYANYKDYYYLPAQDQAIHKSISSFVDKSHREQAKAETCYTRKQGSFLPEWNMFREPFFKNAYKDPIAYFELTSEMKKDKKFFNEYATYVYWHIVGNK